MMTRRTWWLWFHLALIASCAIGAPLKLSRSTTPAGFESGSWSFPWLVAGICLFGVVALVWIQTVNPRARARWMRPSLNSSSLVFAQPIQTFYVGSLCIMAGGVGYLVLGFLDAKVRWFWEVPLPAGIGGWLGIQLCLRAFPDRFEQDPSVVGQ